MTTEPTADVRTEALRLISNGVYVLTACGPDAIHAATVTWVSQASIQPPLVVVALRRNSHLAQAVRKAHRFALNILADDQAALAEPFFSHRTEQIDATLLAQQPFRFSIGRCPLLTEALGWLECKLVAEPSSPGDHALLLGEVVGAGLRRQGNPLVLWATSWAYGGLRDQ